MITKAFYTERPESIKYMLLPSGDADLWMRKNIIEIIDNETYMISYEADETYMITSATEEEIAANFDMWYEVSASWQVPKPQEPPKDAERISALETLVLQIGGII